MPANFDLSSLAISSLCPGNALLYDDKGLPSVMVFIPKFQMNEVIPGGSDRVHPAFRAGNIKSGIWISKFQNVVHGGRAYSLPGKDPKTYISFDAAVNACALKAAGNPGWHLMTAAEWGAIALWCKANGHLPFGNNGNGKDFREPVRKAIPMYINPDGKVLHVGTGTGPVTWSHDGTAAGIYDLNGNVNDWLGGLRLVCGELQVIEDNATADINISQSAGSAFWKAVDGTTGALITPNGSGTTPNSLKLEWTGSAWRWQTAAPANRGQNVCFFKDVTVDADVTGEAKELLYALALAPDDPSFDYGYERFVIHNSLAEAMMFRGGTYANGGYAGIFYANMSQPRTLSSNYGITLRASWYDENEDL